LTGCTDWMKALRWQDGPAGIDWGTQWPKLRKLKVYTGLRLAVDSDFAEVDRYVTKASEALAIEMMLLEVRKREGKGSTWIEVLRDDAKNYEEFWRGGKDKDARRKRLDSLIDKDEAPDWKLTIWQHTREYQMAVDSW